MKLFLVGLLLTTFALANNDLTHRPKSFSTRYGKAAFVDFQEANYDITYDITARKAYAVATIKFNMVEEGRPVFDSYESPDSVFLNGEQVTSSKVDTPNNETTVRIVDKVLSANTSHTLTIKITISALVDFSRGTVKSAFWMSDLQERKFLERYLPANLEFDRVKMTINVNYIGATTKHIVYSNGEITETSPSSYKIVYPEYYTASSLYFHTVPEGATEELRFTLKSVDGREIPVVVYFSKNSRDHVSLIELKNETTAIFHELEGDYGAWLHPSITVYNAGSGGMEYCGATITSYEALGHELTHSYFARGVMPANGNAGWIDEAIASWRDKGYKSLESLKGSSTMSARAYYTRYTDSNAYSFGENFMRYLNNKFSSQGGLKPFLRFMVENRAFSPIFVQDFVGEMNFFYTTSVNEDFKRYTYNNKNPTTYPNKLNESKHPIHHKMTEAELKKHL